MKEWRFYVTVCFGKGDYGETIVSYKLSDDLFDFLTVASKLQLDFSDFFEANDFSTISNSIDDIEKLKKIDADTLHELYVAVYDEACVQIREELIENEVWDEDDEEYDSPDEIYDIDIHIAQ